MTLLGAVVAAAVVPAIATQGNFFFDIEAFTRIQYYELRLIVLIIIVIPVQAVLAHLHHPVGMLSFIRNA